MCAVCACTEDKTDSERTYGEVLGHAEVAGALAHRARVRPGLPAWCFCVIGGVYWKGDTVGRHMRVDADRRARKRTHLSIT